MKKDEEPIIKTTAGKVEFIMKLLGGEKIYNEYGEEVGETPAFITKEEALDLLNKL